MTRRYVVHIRSAQRVIQAKLCWVENYPLLWQVKTATTKVGWLDQVFKFRISYTECVSIKGRPKTTVTLHDQLLGPVHFLRTVLFVKETHKQ